MFDYFWVATAFHFLLWRFFSFGKMSTEEIDAPVKMLNSHLWLFKEKSDIFSRSSNQLRLVADH